MRIIDISEETSAEPPTVFALVRDGAVWPTCSPSGSFELESEGETEREGVGAVRVFRTGAVHHTRTDRRDRARSPLQLRVAPP